jgi:mitochondrial import inner membrane translocase subunit TIM23
MAGPSIFQSGDDNSAHGADSDRRQYNPYQGLNIPYRTLYDLPTSPEFLFEEESLAQRRSWGENLTYYTGLGYLGGSIAGSAVGFRRATSAAEPGDSFKIRTNRILNSCGQDGRRLGNRMGVIGLLFAGAESGMIALRDTDDWINTVVAGLGTGAVFRAAGGVRSAAVAGALGGLMAAGAVAGRQAMKRYVPI